MNYNIVYSKIRIVAKQLSNSNADTIQHIKIEIINLLP